MKKNKFIFLSLAIVVITALGLSNCKRKSNTNLSEHQSQNEGGEYQNPSGFSIIYTLEDINNTIDAMARGVCVAMEQCAVIRQFRVV